MANCVGNLVPFKRPITLEKMQGRVFKTSMRFIRKKRGCLPWETPDQQERDERQEHCQALCGKKEKPKLNFKQLCDPCHQPDECAQFFEKKGPKMPYKIFPVNEAVVKPKFPGGPVPNWQAIQAAPPPKKPEGC